jgi:Terminase large subunit, T4likevirus-type, N-terminal
MTIDDVEHYSDDEKQKIIASYPAHEAEARVKGIPLLGSGRVFPVAEEAIACEHRDFPPHWPRIGGMDFSWDHPFAAVELVWDRDADVVYVSRTYRVNNADYPCGSTAKLGQRIALGMAKRRQPRNLKVRASR